MPFEAKTCLAISEAAMEGTYGKRVMSTRCEIHRRMSRTHARSSILKLHITVLGTSPGGGLRGDRGVVRANGAKEASLPHLASRLHSVPNTLPSTCTSLLPTSTFTSHRSPSRAQPRHCGVHFFWPSPAKKKVSSISAVSHPIRVGVSMGRGRGMIRSRGEDRKRKK